MNKETAKKIARYVVPMLLAVAAAYGYVDQSCQCAAPVVSETPPVTVSDAEM